MPAVGRWGMAGGESRQQTGWAWDGDTNLSVPISTGTRFNRKGSSFYQPSGWKGITVYSERVTPTSHSGALAPGFLTLVVTLPRPALSSQC